ncbi:hypothetical protein SK128_008380 [Halocaridina rubra]|uniref:Uncharacterized protein n=1 Tax=Halocaridina rubra TaxID=373956 RepID=A0AAN8WSU4_HALRR
MVLHTVLFLLVGGVGIVPSFAQQSNPVGKFDHEKVFRNYKVFEGLANGTVYGWVGRHGQHLQSEVPFRG